MANNYNGNRRLPVVFARDGAWRTLSCAGRRGRTCCAATSTESTSGGSANRHAGVGARRDLTDSRGGSVSGAPGEGDLPAGQVGRGVGGVVGAGVVAGAEQQPVVVGPAAAAPGDRVVQVAQAGWPVAALGGAAALFEGLGDPLGSGVEAPGAAEVEDLGLPAEDGGDDPGLARQSPSLAGTDRSRRCRGRAAWRPPRRASRVMVTTTVALTPPAFGRSLVG